ncbi:regulatory protein YycI of two-component signal transduction system YycFG [Geomicrobium halophilum]|uniref:Regulatory protein YycI of two-component signal transduction system YycFG n=1 Tax=Geomicrobium halophilum TaxID=549000 RepID=A0A841Q0A4_9BACL|nr:two-component system regulatory protein YycI [Geomicrobium halophilum]MBB6450565.1 regulatory protein YycI of two-component signal transduction system YycFG [Geomicrobium halophilum]
MDWSKTKTIFIFTFLLLNVFLSYQLFEKVENEPRSMEGEASLEEGIERSNIEIEAELPDDDIPLFVVSSTILESIPEEMEDMYDDEMYSSIDVEDGEVTVWLDEPFEISEDERWQDIRNFIDNNVYEGEDYRYAYTDELQIEYYWHHQGRTLIAPEYTHLSLYENEDGDIQSFSQRLVHTENKEEQSTNSAMEAIEHLISEIDITPNSAVTHVDHVYYSALLEEEYEGQQVLYAPYYRIWVEDPMDDEEDRYADVYMVDAVDGTIVQIRS